MITRYSLPDMCCGSEASAIEKRLGNVSGVESLTFDLISRRVEVRHSLPNEEPIHEAFRSLGMEFQQASAEACSIQGCACCTGEKKPDRRFYILLGLSGFLAFAAEIAAWSLGSDAHWAVISLALAAIAASGKDVAAKGWASIRTFTLNINFLMSIAIVGAVALGSWPEAAMVCFLFALAEEVESFSAEHARNAIRGLVQMAPDTASVRGPNGEWQTMPSKEVTVGQTCLIKPGERIPFDGVVTAGSSSVNQAPITGESIPIDKNMGDTVFAGTVNESGALEFRVTADEGHTTLARIIHTVESAQAQRAPTQRLVDGFARYYTPVIVVAALLVAGVPPLVFGQSFSEWFYKALVLLVISCPCALVLSTPITVVSGLAMAAKRGILIKGGVHLENGRKLKAVALDKTGTLTQGTPVVTDVAPLDGVPMEDVLRIAASLSALSDHPISRAITAAWQGELLPAGNFSTLVGRGVTAEVDGKRYYLGNHRLAEENEVCGDHVEGVLFPLEAEGKTVVALTTEHTSVGVIAVADTLRDTSVEAVRDLHRLGIASIMLTGDNQATASAVAQKSGIDDVRAELLPEDKLVAIEGLKSHHGVVGMVGDGINDAPALATANLGFAMGAAGTDVALETADVALMDDDLRKLPEFVRLSRRTAKILKQNIGFAIGIKIVFFWLALTGHASLWMAVFADMGGSLVVVANGLRMLRDKSPGEIGHGSSAPGDP